MTRRGGPRVVFDAGILAVRPTTGVGRSFLHALTAYAELEETCPILLAPAGDHEARRIPGLEIASVHAPSGFAARSRVLPRLLRDLDADVYHSPVTAIPWRAPCPMIATVHDVPWVEADAPREAGVGGWRHRCALRHAGRRAGAIFSVSQATFRAVERALGHPPRGRHEVHHHALPRSTTVAAANTPEDRRLGPIVALTNDRPRKNLARLRQAHARARSIDPALPALQIVGPPDAWIEEDDKRDLLRRASALACVSLFEGFGLPILEGFAADLPVLCSDRGAMREIAGDAATLVDPHDTEAIALALLRITTDEDLRHTLVRRGAERLASAFDPRRRALAWLHTHRELAEGHGKR